MRRRRRGALEINLTPLLDVLFSILFIVMMTGMQQEQGIKKDYEEQLTQMEQTVTTQEETILKLKEQIHGFENQEESLIMYQTKAVVLTVRNGIEEGKHFLEIRNGLDTEDFEYIWLGADRAKNTQNRLQDIITKLVEETDNQPIYIVFHCNKELIYTTEYKAVTEAFVSLEEKHKEVFFKMMEDDK